MADAGTEPLRNQMSGPWVNADSTIDENPLYPPRMIRHVSETPHNNSFMDVFLVQQLAARPESVVGSMGFLLILMHADLPFLTLQSTVCDVVRWPRQG